ncbi:hypothetical protein GMLC_10660 [Geomonas limicola]|uniref:Uncharacterized protein n=1 Tax=Geomonas limicola TaxID=2740186 RepID=A0A6V8N6N1_9BACT|nr:hypothetical protein [Geomonas limicola]GFO67487.1 hypothetical protein GMLC_10660 [Geomonas limicola]
MAKLQTEVSNAELFIELVRRALPNESAHAALCKVWEQTSREMLNELTLELYARLVSSFHVSYRPSSAATVTPLRSADPDTSPRAEAILEWMRLDSERQKAHHDLHGSKYSWFQSSWLLADFLEVAFPHDLNPGKVIADYLDDIFPDAPLEEHQHLVGANKPGATIYHGSQVHDLIREIGRAALGNAALESRQKQCLAAVIEGFLDPRSQLLLEEGIFLEEVVVAGVQAPAGE